MYMCALIHFHICAHENHVYLHIHKHTYSPPPNSAHRKGLETVEQPVSLPHWFWP